ncbi:hypothetical protein COCON_G00235290, partial [Conger conger]
MWNSRDRVGPPLSVPGPSNPLLSLRSPPSPPCPRSGLHTMVTRSYGFCSVHRVGNVGLMPIKPFEFEFEFER